MTPRPGALIRRSRRSCSASSSSILDEGLLERILSEFEVDLVFHLAALLSTRSEFTPKRAHEVNVEGTLTLLEFAQKEAESHGRPVKFLYPSSIAAYGLPDLPTKARAAAVREDDFNHPTTMYGCNKLYCELLGRYYARHYKQLAAETLSGKVDFRAVRFPGLISALTLPSGGTSDYAPEMIHAAARGEAYSCFVRPDSRIPFMVMPDGVDALIRLAEVPRGDSLERRTTSRRSTRRPTRFADRHARVPRRAHGYAVDVKRQGIVDSWPAAVDDSGTAGLGFRAGVRSLARVQRVLIPTIRKRYQ